ncbi:serine/threonine-protein kinase [Actinomadura alba]|uniref:non-specific serine/threonine protein kinase n=1 Tax=Actinomadura alba TaxID=406431 RepID=A0ABR7LQ21_9ACTN|nr:serine/threonine-protein kinase [Actinomadura alba]MBC6466845.1 protein kinase [Actinomadura alba]
MHGDGTLPGYSHLRELGKGPTGRVVLAMHEATDTPVAIKYLSDQMYENDEFAERFRTEARRLAEMRQPHLVRFLQYTESPVGGAVVMELVNGITLADLIASEGSIRPEAALTVLKGTLLGLGAVHAAGVLHRDCKPGNVLLRSDGVSKLTDVGIAVRTVGTPVAGTPAYMAPELWEGGPATLASDLYAATAVFYECVTGAPPFQTAQVARLAEAHLTGEVPVEWIAGPLREIVARGLAKDPGERPASAAEMLAMVDETAEAEYGDGWVRLGMVHLAQLAGLLALRGPTPRSDDTDDVPAKVPADTPGAAETEMMLTEPARRAIAAAAMTQPIEAVKPIEPVEPVQLIRAVPVEDGDAPGAPDDAPTAVGSAPAVAPPPLPVRAPTRAPEPAPAAPTPYGGHEYGEHREQPREYKPQASYTPQVRSPQVPEPRIPPGRHDPRAPYEAVADREKGGKSWMIAAAAMALLLLGGGLVTFVGKTGEGRPAAIAESPAGEPSATVPSEQDAPQIGQPAAGRTRAAASGTPTAPDETSPAPGTSDGSQPAGRPRATRPGQPPTQPQHSTPPPKATTATGLSIGSWTRSGQVGSASITVTADGTGPINVSISYTSGGTSVAATTKRLSGARSYTFGVTQTFTTDCEDWTIVVTARPGGLTRTATIPAAECGAPSAGGTAS